MTVSKIFLFIFLNFIVTFAKISDKRSCANKDCSEPVSLAKTLIRYNSDDSRILSFVSNEVVKIFSKSAGSRSDLWGAEIKGKRGYVPKQLVRESKIFHHNLTFLVDTEGEDDPAYSSTPKTVTETILVDKADDKLPEISKPVEDISPNTVTPAYEIIDGTTLYLTDPPDYSSTPSSVDDLVQHSNEDLKEHVIEATLPVNPDTKSVVENLNSETKIYESVEQKQNKVNEKILDLSLEQNLENKTEVVNSNENVEKETELNSIENVEKETELNSIENVEKDTKLNSIEDVEKKTEINSIEDVEKKTEALETDEKNKPESNENFDIDADIETESGEIDYGEDEVEVDDGDDDNDDDEEEEEVPIISEKSVNNDFPNAKDNEIIQKTESTQDVENNVSSENLNVETPKILTENNSVSNNENLNSSTLEQKISVDEHINNLENDSTTTTVNISAVETNAEYAEHLKDNIKNSDMNKFDTARANNEPNTFQNDSANMIVAEESTETVEQQKIDPTLNAGVPSLFSNPLNFFSSQKDKDEEPKVENIQVPEFSTSEHESNTATEFPEIPITDIKFTTVTPIIQEDDPLIFERILNDKTPEFIDIQHDNSIKQSELLKDINSDFSFESKDIDLGKNYDSLEYSQNNIGIGSVEEIHSNSVVDQTNDNNKNIDNLQNSSENTSDEPGFFSSIFSNLFGSKEEANPSIDSNENTYDKVNENSDTETVLKQEIKHSFKDDVEENPLEKYLSSAQPVDMQSCTAGQDSSCPFAQNQNYIRSDENGDISWSYEIPENAYAILLYLTLTAITVLVFSLGYYYIEKRRKDGRLIVKMNELEKKLLVATKECQSIQNELKITKENLESVEDTTCDSNEVLELLKEELEAIKFTKLELEEQIASLENELENATETGMEMSQMLNELLTSQSGNEHLMKTINGLQKQVNDQKVTLNHTQSKLSDKNTESELLQTELQVANEKVFYLQSELDKMVVNILSVQEEKTKIETDYETQIVKLTTEHDSVSTQLNKQLKSLQEQVKIYNSLMEDTKRSLDLKSTEFDLLKQSMKDIEAVQSNKESMKALLDVSHVKAEVLQLREEKHKLLDKLQKEIDNKLLNEKEVQVMLQEVKILKDKFDEAEREKVEAETRLEVLSSYFKEREAQFQKEINDNETKWMQKEGEATSTVERIKWIQEELQNYKSQNELLKKEILDQEVSLKSQISMLEKKGHENWLLARQAERKLEESKQEASQLRNRLTIVEKNLNNSSQMNDESMIQNRIMSLEANGDVAISPLHMTNPENPGSPPLLFPQRDHMTTSPPLPGLPPFMQPPPGVHFMPPPGVPPFMPPPPVLFPGDHRPPPLGRMSSPPLHGRYSPDSRTYSPYDRDDSPPLSPAYTDDYRRRSPPPSVNHLPPRNYSPYSAKHRYWDDKMEYRGQHQHRSKSRPHKGMSSGSGNSNESLDNSGRHSGRV